MRRRSWIGDSSRLTSRRVEGSGVATATGDPVEAISRSRLWS